MELGGFEQKHREGDGYEDEGPSAGFLHRGEAGQQRSEGGHDVNSIAPRHGGERAGCAGVQAGKDEDQEEPREDLRVLEIQPLREAPDEPRHSNAGEKGEAPRGEALGRWLDPGKGEVEAKPAERNQHNRIEPADVQGGRMGRKRPGDEDDRGAKSENSPNPAGRKSRRVISAPIFWSMEALPDGVGTGGCRAPAIAGSGDNPGGRKPI